MTQDETANASMPAEIFAGVGIGLLLGIIVGLSASPVVQTLVGALTSLLAVFLGLESRVLGEKASFLSLRMNNLRIGSLGIATVAGILIGLFIRINNPLAAPLSDHVTRWNDAFPDNPVLAAQMAIFDWNKIQPEAVAYDPKGPAMTATRDNDAAKTAGAVLFSSLSDYNVCQQLRPSYYLGDPVKILTGYRAPGAPKMLGPVADKIEAMPANVHFAALTMTHELLCNIQKEGRK